VTRTAWPARRSEPRLTPNPARPPSSTSSLTWCSFLSVSTSLTASRWAASLAPPASALRPLPDLRSLSEGLLGHDLMGVVDVAVSTATRKSAHLRQSAVAEDPKINASRLRQPHILRQRSRSRAPSTRRRCGGAPRPAQAARTASPARTPSATAGGSAATRATASSDYAQDPLSPC